MGILDKLKHAVSKAKGTADDLVESNSDKIPDSVENAYDKASESAGKVLPDEDEPGE